MDANKYGSLIAAAPANTAVALLQYLVIEAVARSVELLEHCLHLLQGVLIEFYFSQLFQSQLFLQLGNQFRVRHFFSVDHQLVDCARLVIQFKPFRQIVDVKISFDHIDL